MIVLTTPSDKLIRIFVELENIRVEDGDSLLEPWFHDKGIGEELKSGEAVCNSAIPKVEFSRRPLIQDYAHTL